MGSINRKMNLEDLIEIMNELREKCPWDQKQTIHSLRNLTIEEVFELVDEIDENNWTKIKEELGDILLHIVFYTKLASEQRKFDIYDVITYLIEKLKRRHPHIYGELKVKDENDVKSNWEKIKLTESKNKRVLDGIPNHLPEIIKAYRLQDKAAGVGFDWDNINDNIAKIHEEMDEVKNAETIEDQEKEIGDVLFAVVNYARKLGVNPDKALKLTNQKFKTRFSKIEDELNDKNIKWADSNLAFLDEIWNKIKRNEKNK